MHNVLSDILRRKREQIAKYQVSVPLDRLVGEANGFTHKSRFKQSLQNAQRAGAIIAEIKIASPTHAELGSLADATIRARIYEEAGADAISFITEEHYFKTDLDDLVTVQRATKIPVLQKDFIIDPYQIYLSHQAGVDALLFIAGLVEGPELVRLVAMAVQLGIEPVVEINNRGDLDKALDTNTSIIAVNARDLRTFDVDVKRACALIKQVPNQFLRLGFSGVSSAEDVGRYRMAGADGVLVGTSLMQAEDPGAFLRNLRGVR